MWQTVQESAVCIKEYIPLPYEKDYMPLLVDDLIILVEAFRSADGSISLYKGHIKGSSTIIKKIFAENISIIPKDDPMDIPPSPPRLERQPSVNQRVREMKSRVLRNNTVNLPSPPKRGLPPISPPTSRRVSETEGGLPPTSQKEPVKVPTSEKEPVKVPTLEKEPEKVIKEPVSSNPVESDVKPKFHRLKRSSSIIANSGSTSKIPEISDMSAGSSSKPVFQEKGPAVMPVKPSVKPFLNSQSSKVSPQISSKPSVVQPSSKISSTFNSATSKPASVETTSDSQKNNVPNVALKPQSIIQQGLQNYSNSSIKSSVSPAPVKLIDPNALDTLVLDKFNSEVLDILRVWNQKLKKYIDEKKYDKFQECKPLIDRLYQGRKLLNNPQLQLSNAEFEQIRRDMLVIIEEGNSVLEDEPVQNLAQVESIDSQKINSIPANTAKSSKQVDHPTSIATLYKMHARIEGGEQWSSSSFIKPSSSTDIPISKSSQAPTPAEVARSSDTPHHLFFELKACVAMICGQGEMTEMAFSIYNKSLSKFVSEPYIVKLTYNGMPIDQENIGKLYTLFTELTSRDIGSQLFIVCRIVRIGKMLLNEKENNSSFDDSSKHYQPFRRPFGYAILDVSEFSRDFEYGVEKEYMMRIYTPSNESLFPTLYENIINKQGGFETNSRAEMIIVGMKMFSGEVKKIANLDPNIALTPRCGFPDIILPGDVRNSIYVTLNAGDFLQGRKTTGKNLEISVQLRDGYGIPIQNSLFIGTGEKPSSTFDSIVYYHSNSSKWLETIRVDIPFAQFDRGTHLFFYFRHCSTTDKASDKTERSFAFSVVPLMNSDDTAIGDGLHSLQLVKFDKKFAAPESYLPVFVPHNSISGGDASTIPPWSPSGQSNFEWPVNQSESSLLAAISDSKMTSLKDQFSIKTSLCSTKVTQDVSLLNFLKWKKLPKSAMRKVLKDFTFIGPVEMIKYLQNILDTLFGLLQEFCGNTEEAHDVTSLAFSALIFTLNTIVSDKRFVNFRHVLDVYISNHFAKSTNAYIWKSLFNSLTLVLNNPKDSNSGKELRSAVKAWEYLFKFIVKSRFMNSQRIRLSSSDEQEFRSVVYKYFELVAENILLVNTKFEVVNFKPKEAEKSEAALIGTQIILLQNVHLALNELAGTSIFSPKHLTNIATQFLCALNNDKRKVIETKLQLSIQLLRSSLFEDAESRVRLVDIICLNVQNLINSITDMSLLDLCLQVVLELVDILSPYQPRSSADSLNRLFPNLIELLNTMFISLNTLKTRFPNEKDELIEAKMVEYAVSLLSVFNMMKDEEITYFFRDKLIRSENTNSLDNFFSMIRFWLSGDIGNTLETSHKGHLPSKWISMQSIQHTILFRIISVAADVLRSTETTTKKCFSKKTWVNFVQLFLRLLICSQTVHSILSCEERAEDSMRLFCSPHIFDFRSKSVGILKGVWSFLSDRYEDFLPVIVGQLIELTFFKDCNDLRNLCVSILVDVMVLDQKISRNQTWVSKGPSRNETAKSRSGLSRKLTSIELEFIDTIERLVMTERKGDESYEAWLLDALRSRLSDNREAMAFLYTFQQFLSLSLSTRNLSSVTSDSINCAATSISEDSSDDERASLLSQLLHFTALFDRNKIYVKYAHKLADIHLLQNPSCFAEAGWSYMLHANLLEWNTDSFVESVDTDVSLELLEKVLVTPPKSTKSSAEKEKSKSPILNVTLLNDLLVPSDINGFMETQTCFRRKELLHLIAIYLFTLEKHFEHAISLSEVLAHQYRNTIYDYDKLSKIHLVISDLHSKISQKTRFFPEYYRVAFLGRGWKTGPLSFLKLYGKHYVYRGKDFERLGDFCDRLLSKYPDSQLCKSSSWPPDNSITESDEKWIQISKVDPNANQEAFSVYLDPLNIDRIPERVRNWYTSNETTSFCFSRPFKKPLPKTSKLVELAGNNEFLNLWIEEFTITSESGFPYYLRRSEIIDIERKEIMPIENAIRSMETKNKELIALEKRFRPIAEKYAGGSLSTTVQSNEQSDANNTLSTYSSGSASSFTRTKSFSISSNNIQNNAEKKETNSSNPVSTKQSPSENTSQFTMSLNGAVDAPVNGGLPMYRKAFLNDTFLTEFPDCEKLILRLRQLIDEQAQVLGRCIVIHSFVAPPEMLPLHEQIVQFYHRNFADEIGRL